MESPASEGQILGGANHSNQRLHSNHSNPYNSLENSTIFYKSSGVGVGHCGGKVTVEVLDRARAYAAAVPGAISGSRGHNQTFALANALTWGFALDEQTALTLMLEWNAGCQPPWKERDLRRKVRESQNANHQKPFGYLLTAGERPQSFRAPQVAPPAQMAVWKVKRKPARAEADTTGSQLSVPSGQEPTTRVESSSIEPSLAEEDGLVRVPGCTIPRPVEIEVDDDTWRAIEAAGFIEEPTIQAALWVFGPGCTVIESGKETSPCGS